MRNRFLILALLVAACSDPLPNEPDAGDEVDASIDPPTCAPEPAGLRARWRGENDVAEETGQYPGTAIGGVAYSPGPHGTAFSFDGDDGVWADPGDALWPAGSFTVEAWMRSTVSDHVWQTVLEKYGCGGADGCDGSFWGLYMTEEGRAYFGMRVNGVTEVHVTASVIPIDDGAWHHLVGVRDVDAGQLLLYIDGILAVSTPLRPEDAGTMSDVDGVPDVVTIGVGRQSGVDTFANTLAGSIDEAAYYVAAWTANEVAAIYAAPDGICR